MKNKMDVRCGSGGMTGPILIIFISLVLVITIPTKVRADDFELKRLGAYNIGWPVRALDMSNDGQWIVAGGSAYDYSEGGVYLFQRGIYTYVWRDIDVRPFSDTNWGIRGTSHPIAISKNGTFFSVGTIAASSSDCTGTSVGGCVFFYQNQGSSSTRLWYHEFSDPVVTTDIAMSDNLSYAWIAVGSNSLLSVYTLDGTLFWQTQLNGAIHHVRISSNGDYLAWSSCCSNTGYIELYKKERSGYSRVWYHTSGPASTIINIDFDEDGLLLAAGEDFYGTALPLPTNLTQFCPGTNGWDSSDGTPCSTYIKPGDVYGVAVSRNLTANLTGNPFRVVVGRSPPPALDPYAQQFPFCNSTPINEWGVGDAESYTLSVDSSVSGCVPNTYCFSVFGSSDGGVHLVREGSTRVRSNYTGGAVNAIVMAPQLITTVVAGSDDGYVYFYEIAIVDS